MKNFKFLILLLGIITIGVVACSNDEGNDNNHENTDSNDLSLQNNVDFEKQDFKIPQELVYNRQGQEFLYDKLYPIGWSKDGMFAYVTEPADEGSGLYWFEIIIYDIVNNKVAWSWKPSESEEGNIEQVWNDNYELFKQHLNKAEILQLKTFELKPTKTSYKGNDYELVLETKTEKDPSYGFDIIKELNLQIISPELGNKQFLSKKSEDYSMIVGAIIPGYLMSPYDDRIVVICKKERIGYEGPPNVAFFDLAGTDLIRGFANKNEE